MNSFASRNRRRAALGDLLDLNNFGDAGLDDEGEQIFEREFVVVILEDEEDVAAVEVEVVGDDLDHGFMVDVDERLGEGIAGLLKAGALAGHRNDDVHANPLDCGARGGRVSLFV